MKRQRWNLPAMTCNRPMTRADVLEITSFKQQAGTSIKVNSNDNAQPDAIVTVETCQNSDGIFQNVL